MHIVLEEIDPLKGTETISNISGAARTSFRRDRSPEGDGNKKCIILPAFLIFLEEIDPLKGTETDPND